MRIVIFTQNDVFYLGRHLDYLIKNMPSFVQIDGFVVLGFSPFGKESYLLKKIYRIYESFGLFYSLKYMIKYLHIQIFDRKYLIRNILNKYNIPEIKLPNNNINSAQSLNMLNSLKLDLIISISANQIFKKKLLQLPKYGCINLHTALLPKYKGLMPTFWALKNNEPEIGVTVFFMDEGIDTGDIIVQDKLPILPSDTLELLINKTKRLGMDAIIKAINLIYSGNAKTFRPPEEGSYYTFPTRKDVNEFIASGKLLW